MPIDPHDDSRKDPTTERSVMPQASESAGTPSATSPLPDDPSPRLTDDSDVPMSPLGAVFRRIAAFLYDALLLVAVLFVVTAIALVPNDGRAIESPLYLLVVLAIAWLFLDWFWRHGGQTLGMRAWRLKLVDDGDGSLTRRRTFVRYALGCALFGITLLAVPFDPRRRAMHDRLTRTRVVRVRKE